VFDIADNVTTQRSVDDSSRKLNKDKDKDIHDSNCNSSVDFIKGLQQLQKVCCVSYL